MKCFICNKKLSNNENDSMSHRDGQILCDACVELWDAERNNECPNDCNLCGSVCIKNVESGINHGY